MQSKLVATKRMFIEDKDVRGIKVIPLDPRPKVARKICDGYVNGQYRAFEKAFYDNFEEGGSGKVWRTIQV